MEQALLEKEPLAKDAPPSWMAEYERKVKMSVEEQEAEMKLNWPEIQVKAKALDERLAENEICLNEDEIADIVSEFRRRHYEASVSH
ncbi:hypothetical protein [Parasediminibacterium sp. JCM 36343]|uniref:hypothetical protein n=1 Tax=Parasediminibacterium sp. JCM 36343 TaxID=3374279 RepID=UPI003979ACF7